MCDAERGVYTPWAMSQIAMGELQKRHDAGHSENQQIPSQQFPNKVEEKIDELVRSNNAIWKLLGYVKDILEGHHVQYLGSLGGKARALKMSKEEKSEHAKRMVRAREAKRRTPKKTPLQ